MHACTRLFDVHRACLFFDLIIVFISEYSTSIEDIEKFAEELKQKIVSWTDLRIEI